MPSIPVATFCKLASKMQFNQGVKLWNSFLSKTFVLL